MTTSAIEGHRIWSRHYDETPNALLALEARILPECLGAVVGRHVLDAGSGTGRWMSWAKSRGASVFGIDACREMLLESERKPHLTGLATLADIRAIPLPDNQFDLAICSFTLGYLPSIRNAIRELARVARQVVVSDLHPDAIRQGWTRSFRAGTQVYELTHYEHPIAELDDCARSAGLMREWRREALFGEPERGIFQRAGKESVFETVREVRAVLITSWRRQSD
jgi:SAM-dependent methyltransferase